MSSKEIVGIQYLRGLAALWVVIDHCAGMMAFPKYFGRKILGGALEYGAVGVDQFFVISGFIIVYVSLDHQGKPKVGLADYARRRFVRIVPLMWLAVGSYASLRFLVAAELPLAEYLRAAFLLPWYNVNPSVIWTLRHELIFYTLFGVSFLKWRSATPIIIIWVISPFIYSILSLPNEPTDIIGQIARRLTFPVNFEFGAGLILGLFVKRYPITPLRLPVDGSWVVVFCMIATFYLAKFIDLTHDSLSKTLIITAVCSVTLLSSIVFETNKSSLNSMLYFLGSASFAIYLFHLHALSAILIILSKVAPEQSLWTILIIGTAAAVLAGIFVHLVIEKPLINAIGKWMRPSQGAGPFSKTSSSDKPR